MMWWIVENEAVGGEVGMGDEEGSFVECHGFRILGD